MTTSRMTELLRQAEGTDPLAALRALVGIRAELERREAVLVRRARVRGASWGAIAAVLGSSRQAVHRKHGGGWLHDAATPTASVTAAAAAARVTSTAEVSPTASGTAAT